MGKLKPRSANADSGRKKNEINSQLAIALDLTLNFVVYLAMNLFDDASAEHTEHLLLNIQPPPDIEILGGVLMPERLG